MKKICSCALVLFYYFFPSPGKAFPQGTAVYPDGRITTIASFKNEVDSYVHDQWIFCSETNVEYYVSYPIEYEDRLYSISILKSKTSENFYLRPIYRSQSSLVWRSPSHFGLWGYYGKGYSERDTDLPVAVQRCLGIQAVENKFGNDRGKYFINFWKSTLKKTYRFKAPSEYLDSVELPKIILTNPDNKNTVTFSDNGFYPNYQTLSCWPLALTTRYASPIKACTVKSKNEKIQFLFLKDSHELWLATSEFIDEQITIWGNRKKSPDLSILYHARAAFHRNPVSHEIEINRESYESFIKYPIKIQIFEELLSQKEVLK